MALAIIIAAAAALPTWFLTQGNIVWTAIAAGGGAALPGLISYIFFRCVCRKSQIKKEAERGEQEHKEAQITETQPDGVRGSAKPVDPGVVHIKSTTAVETLSECDRGPAKPVVKGTFYIKSTQVAPIRQDRHFRFGQRIKKENGEPLTVKEDDLYLELVITFDYGQEEFCALNSDSRYFMPSSLFEGVQEGGTLRFLYDGILIEWTCSQIMHPELNGRLPLEQFIELAKRHSKWERTQFGWEDDIEGEPRFMDRLIGRELYEIDANGTRIASSNFEYYEKDIMDHGPYQALKEVGYYGDNLVFNVHCDHIDLSDVKFFESKGFHDLHQFWILIPHKPEKNKLSGNADSVICDDGTYRKSFTKESFDPQSGDRWPLYHHGQWFMCAPRDAKNAALYFNKNGWLTLRIERLKNW